jgi:two-component system nitrate/nitrite sensor histidine kinase NarX
MHSEHETLGDGLSNRRPLFGWPTTGQFLGARSALGVILLILGVLNIWFLLHSPIGSWLHLANSILLLGGVLLLAYAFSSARRNLLAPLNELRNWVNNMREGQLSARLPRPDQPDFKVLYQEINALGERLESRCNRRLPNRPSASSRRPIHWRSSTTSPPISTRQAISRTC